MSDTPSLSRIGESLATGQPEKRSVTFFLEAGLLRLDSSPGVSSEIGRAATAALASFNRVIESGSSEALLFCPQSLESATVLHGLASLQRLSICDEKTLTTICYPWSRNNATAFREILVDRAALIRCIHGPLNRMNNRTAQSAARYVNSLQSLNSVLDHNKRSAQLRTALIDNPGLEHPTLFELMPQVAITLDGIQSYSKKFLERLRKYTWLKMNGSGEDAASPQSTPFYLVGIGQEVVDVEALKKHGLDPRNGGRKPDLIVLELTRNARRRLGFKWKEYVSDFLDAALLLYVENAPPVFAVTDDVFCLQELRFALLKEYDKWRSDDVSATRRPAGAELILNRSRSVFAPPILVGRTNPKVAVDVYGTDGLRAVEAGLKLKRRLLSEGETLLADVVTAASRVIQNLLALPGEPKQFFRFLHEYHEGFRLESKGTRLDSTKARGDIRSALENGGGGRNQVAIEEFLATFDALVTALDKEHPGGRRFDECLRRLLKKAGKSVVVLPSRTELDFVKWRLENDPFLIDIKSSYGRGFILADRPAAHDCMDSWQSESDDQAKLVFVEPHFETIIDMLARPWTPPNVTLLCNHARAEELAKRLHILLSIDGVGELKDGLSAIETALRKGSASHTSDIGDLDLELKSPRSATVDLTSEYAGGAGAIRIISLSGGLCIKAYDGTELAHFDDDAPNPYSRCLARDVRAGDQICVFTGDFIESARSLLKLSAHAPAVLAKYHSAVARFASQLPGNDFSTKVSALKQRILAFDSSADLPTDKSIRRWIEVEDLANIPRDQVQPHAPKTRKNYDLFMRALGIDVALAEQYWIFGVFGTRSARIKTGAYFHQVLMTILLDIHSLGSKTPELDSVDLWKINELAKDYVETVVSNELEVAQ